MSLERNGMYISKDGPVIFNITGNANYTINGYRAITTPAGTFECIEIGDSTTYSQNVTIASTNGTMIVETNGTITGKYWIEKNQGYLVKFEKSSSRLVQSDLTDLYNHQPMKFDIVYTEIPIEQQIVCELTN